MSSLRGAAALLLFSLPRLRVHPQIPNAFPTFDKEPLCLGPLVLQARRFDGWAPDCKLSPMVDPAAEALLAGGDNANLHPPPPPFHFGSVSIRQGRVSKLTVSPTAGFL